LLAAICAGFAASRTIYEIRTGTVVLPREDWRQNLLVLPRIWLRLQLACMTGFPCIMGITLLYAHYIGFAQFKPS